MNRPMRRRAGSGATALIAAIALAWSVTPVAAVDRAPRPEELGTIVFVNETEFAITHLFFSSSRSRFWGADILGAHHRLEPGERRVFYFDAVKTEEMGAGIDILAINERVDAHLMLRGQLGGDSTIRITADSMESGFDLPVIATVIVENKTGEHIWFGFFTPIDSPVRGIDILGDDVLLFAGTSTTIRAPVGEAAVTYEFLGIDNDGNAYRSSIDLSDRSLRYRLELAPHGAQNH